MKQIVLTLIMISFCSCSLFGIQDEEGPDYKVIDKSEDFEIREYESYVVAKTTVRGNFDDASGDAFRILAGYIFGDNYTKEAISMTSPVKVEQASEKISMTAPVEVKQEGQELTMAFSMPSQYTLKTLPEPNDDRIEFTKIQSKIIASHEYSWFSSKEKNDKKAKELREWISDNPKYKTSPGYTYAGYNPPWTLPFFRRNEVHIELRLKSTKE